MEKTLGLGAIVLMTAAFLLTTSPEPSFAAQSVGNRCGEEPAADGRTQHRFQQSGICVTGGDYHTQLWLGTCVPDNHQSGPCP